MSNKRTAYKTEIWDGSTSYNQYIRDIQRYPLLTRAEEKAVLAAVAKGNREAEQRIVCSNLRFVINVAFLYRNQGLTLPELINEGNIGLIEAARRFDTSRDIKFISYAVWWIRQGITRAIAEKSRIVRISAEKELVLRRFSKVRQSVVQTVGGTYVLDSAEVGRQMGLTVDQVEKVIEMGQRHVSLDARMDEDGETSLLDLLAADSDERPDRLFDVRGQLEHLAHLLDTLSTLERKVLTMYFGVEYGEPFNLQEIGKVVGLSKERVRQIKEKALTKLRERAASHGEPAVSHAHAA